MHPTQKIFALAAAALSLSPALRADDTIAAQPITLSPAVGNDQRDFSITTAKNGDDYVVFDGAVPIKKNTVKEKRTLFSVKVGIPGLFYDTVGTKSPLKKLASYTVPIGTTFKFLLQSDISSDESDVRELYVVPGKGLYITKDDGAPRVLRPDTASSPITGVALRFPANSPTDTTEDEQFRVIFGATDPKKGSEPFESTGTSAGKLLSDIVPGKAGSMPLSFTTYQNEVYFTALTSSNGTRDIFKTTVNLSGKKPVYSATDVSNGNLDTVLDLIGGGAAGLFINSNNYLVNTTDGFSYSYVQTDAATPAYVVYPDEFTPSIDPLDGDFGFDSYDSSTSQFRFTVFNGTDASFPEESGATGSGTTDPVHITSTGNYYYFGATVSGSLSRLARYFTGGTELEYITTQNPGNYVSNVQEMVDVPSGTSGLLYFTADALVDSVQQTDILFTMDPDSGDPVATPVRTISGHTVQMAHNLSSVDNNLIFRLYFTAPVNSTVNSEYATGGLDYGTKPWVVNAP